MRINTKNLRYTLEPMESFEEPAELVAKLKEVQDAIGTWHDWATLHELATKQLDGPGAESVCKELEARAEREFRNAHRTAHIVREQMSRRKPVASSAASSAKQTAENEEAGQLSAVEAG